MGGGTISVRVNGSCISCVALNIDPGAATQEELAVSADGGTGEGKMIGRARGEGKDNFSKKINT